MSLGPLLPRGSGSMPAFHQVQSVARALEVHDGFNADMHILPSPAYHVLHGFKALLNRFGLNRPLTKLLKKLFSAFFHLLQRSSNVPDA